MTAPSPPRTSRAPFDGRRVLITGGLGFIGSNLARHAGRGGRGVTVIDWLVPTHGGNVGNVAGIEGELDVDELDVRDIEQLTRLCASQDFLFNLAGQTSHLDSMTRPPHRPRDQLPRSALAARGLARRQPRARIVFAGTRQIYGRPRSAGRRDASDRPGGRQRHQQDRRRVVPPALRPGLRPADQRPSADQHLRATHARPGRAADVPRPVDPAGARRGGAARVRRRRAAARLHVRRRRRPRSASPRPRPPPSGGVQRGRRRRTRASRRLAELVVRLAGRAAGAMVLFPEDRLAIDIGDYYADDTQAPGRPRLGPACRPRGKGLRRRSTTSAHGGAYWTRA